ncbi:MAG TPA: hypothetical protein VE685_03590 [Thermoanaerobaculia bacterium]|nr:hypothetical protein [Thermoanaerobaculia bacterium]
MVDFILKTLSIPFLIGLVAAVLVFLVEKRWSLGTRSELAKAIFAFLMTTLLSFNLQTLYEVNSVVKRSSIDQLENLKSSLGSDFTLIFGDHFDAMIDGVRGVVEKREMRLSDIDQYRYFYKRVRAAYPDVTFYATSLPREEYFWSPDQVRKNSVEEAIRDHILRGGRFERIFFTSGPDNPKAGEEERVVKVHSRLGINVYYIHEQDLPAGQRRFFLVASNGKVAAEALLGMNNRISELVITVDESQAEHYLRLFEKLKQNPKLQEYRPGDPLR